MKTSFLPKLFILSIIASMIVACKENKPQFTIEGKISNADSTVLYLEKRGLNGTNIVDSVRLSKEGNFKFTRENIGYSEFYLLRMNKQTINLVIDSTETIGIEAPKETFAIDYSIKGSESSKKVKEVVLSQNKLSIKLADLNKQFYNKDLSQEKYIEEAQAAVNEYKDKAKELILSDLQGLASYFALFQKVDNLLIFDPYDKKDLRIFQAVATAWDQHNSASPRAEHLKDFTLTILAEIRKAGNEEENIKKIESITTRETSEYYTINLPNVKNENISTTSLKGKVVVLDFTVYQSDFSLAHNVQLNNVYSKNKDKVEIYQVSFDSDKHFWQNSAINIPWTCVRDEKSLRSDLILKFNLAYFPSTFLLNKNGEIVKKLSREDNLEKEVQKLL